MKKLKPLLLSMSLLLASSCQVVIPKVVFCAFKTTNPALGAFCADNFSENVWEKTETEYLRMLLGDGGETPAVCMSANDFTAYKTALDQACRALGKKCKKAVKESIENLQEVDLSEPD